MFFEYTVGQKIDKFVGHAEETVFDVDNDGAIMLVFFNKPTEQEIKQFESDVSFEIRFTLMYNVIMITTKIGNLNWMDSPYTPHLSPNLSKITIPGTNQGLSLTLILIDCSNGEIRAMKVLGLMERFSKKFLGVIIEEKMKEFDREQYDNNLRRIFASYPTKEIVKISKDYCRIN